MWARCTALEAEVAVDEGELSPAGFLDFTLRLHERFPQFEASSLGAYHGAHTLARALECLALALQREAVCAVRFGCTSATGDAGRA